MSPPTAHEQAFVSYLERLRDDERHGRAAMASLRRGLGKEPGEAAEAHRFVVPWLAPEASQREAGRYYLLASLFAWHQGSWHPAPGSRAPTNLGASHARMARSEEGDSVERRFTSLLNCHEEDLPKQLRQAVGLLKSKEIAIDWSQLLNDLRNWGRETRQVQLAWARAFWGHEAEPAREAVSPPSGESETQTVAAE